jgi:hypothetical protein
MDRDVPAMELTPQDRHDLRRARARLEHHGLAIRIADTVGVPIEKMFAALPAGASSAIQRATTSSLTRALEVVTSRMDDEPRASADWAHRISVAATGAVGGAFGLAALAVELPVSTTIMLRSIADIARSEGHSIKSPRVRLACLEVFALGGPGRGDDAVEAGYYAVRAALARAVSEAAEVLATRGLAEGAPALVGLVTKIGARFGIPVTEKVLAQSVPLIGAAGGAAINVLFINHFHEVARGHFVVLRLEEKYGAAAVRDAYRMIGE